MATGPKPTRLLGQPPNVVTRRRYRALIPGLGIFGFIRRDLQTGKWGCAPGCLVSAILAVLLATGGLLFMYHDHPSGPANLTINGDILPGKSASVHGSNFPPNSTVEIMLDGSPSAFTSYSHRSKGASARNGYVSVWNLIAQERVLHPSNTTVSSDGTFDTTINIPPNWVAGSQHIIQAATRGNITTTQAEVAVTTQQTRIIPTDTPTQIPTPEPPLPPPPTPTPPSPTPTPSPSSQPVSAPNITSISPSSGSSNGGTSVEITGTGFADASTVSFGDVQLGQDEFTVDSDTQITVTSPAGSDFVDVTVTTPAGTSQISSADGFTYMSPPTVTGISPNSGSMEGGTSVVITGTGFTRDATVSFGGVSLSQDEFTVDNDTQITVHSPASKTNGLVDIIVTTPAGTSQTSSADMFTYMSPPPIITGISPNSGPDNGWTTVVITGTGFTNASTVSFGGTTAESFNVDSDTQITARSPTRDTTGSVDIIVTTPAGTSPISSVDLFTYTISGPG